VLRGMAAAGLTRGHAMDANGDSLPVLLTVLGGRVTHRAAAA
jgi:hypothetical protein